MSEPIRDMIQRRIELRDAGIHVDAMNYELGYLDAIQRGIGFVGEQKAKRIWPVLVHGFGRSVIESPESTRDE